MAESMTKASREITEVADPILPGSEAEALLRELATWSNTTTIIIHGGCVFEFKGRFPEGSVGEGFYNLHGPVPGFHGHINLALIDHIAFQERPHRGRASSAFTFQDKSASCIFKVFLGRDSHGELIPEQLAAFKRIKESLSV